MNDVITEMNSDRKDELRTVTAALLSSSLAENENRETMKIPFTKLSAVGSIGASLVPHFRTVTGTVTFNTSGLYEVANAAVGESLKAAKDGTFYGFLKESGKCAKLSEVGRVTGSVKTTLPVNCGQILIAVAIISIDSKLNEIIDTGKQILDFLETDKKAGIESSLQTLSEIISSYRYTWDNELQRDTNHKTVATIKMNSLHEIRFYQEEISRKLRSGKAVTQNAVDNLYDSLKNSFRYYRMALFNYALASFLDIMLSGNFSEDFIVSRKTQIEGFASDYRTFFEKASLMLEESGSRTVDSRIFKSLGAAGRGIGEAINTFPVVNRNTIAERIWNSGNRMTDRAEEQSVKAVRNFASFSSPGTSLITDRMDDIGRIFNHTENILFDSDSLYLVIGGK